MLSFEHCARRLCRKFHSTKKCLSLMSVQENTYSTMSNDKFSLPDRYAGFGSSVWNEFIKVAVEYKPLNLGQGFPDFAAPEHVTKELAAIALDENVLFHQYTRGFGHPRLVQALSKLFSKLVNREINPETEILITIGADEALHCCIVGHTKPGDEVILIEPFYDLYEPTVVAANGIPIFIPLKSGHLRLVQAVSKLYSKLINREINPQTEILITSGAYEALYSCIQGHTKPGDEVIIIEPFFDCYEPMVVAANGVPVFIPLRPKKKSDGPMMSSDWVLDTAELESKFNSRTKAIILNTPNNPLGKVFSLEELTVIANLCKKWNVLCISDEVYEWLIYKPYKHVRMATLPGMWERTITIGSAGKTFSVTGWKIGWAYGPANLMWNLQMVHQNCVYTCPTPIQEAVARGFELEIQRLGTPECYFNSLPESLIPKRDYMAKFLTDVGMKPIIPEGGYFMIADWTGLESKVRLNEETDELRDYRFAKWMSKNVKLQGIPPSAFYSKGNKNLGEDYVRYCFIKKDENLKKAADILGNWKNSSKL